MSELNEVVPRKKLNKKTVFITLGVAGLALFMPEVFAAPLSNAVTGNGATVATDSALGNLMDSYNAYVADIDSKVIAYYKPFMAASATAAGATYIYRRIYR